MLYSLFPLNPGSSQADKMNQQVNELISKTKNLSLILILVIPGIHMAEEEN